jgi:hypothetical protein
MSNLVILSLIKRLKIQKEKEVLVSIFLKND